jgi:hypothetical protein
MHVPKEGLNLPGKENHSIASVDKALIQDYLTKKNMDHSTHNKIVSFIWSIADDCLRDVFVRGKYSDVILPMFVLRRLDSCWSQAKQRYSKKFDSSMMMLIWRTLTPTAYPMPPSTCFTTPLDSL